LETRVNRVFDDDDIAKIANAYHAWRQDGETSEDYLDAPGFCLGRMTRRCSNFTRLFWALNDCLTCRQSCLMKLRGCAPRTKASKRRMPSIWPPRGITAARNCGQMTGGYSA
jgi:hypothetical protein